MIPFQNPSIEILGIRVDEPVTTVTDFIVALIGFMAYFKTVSGTNSRSVQLYRFFFLFTAISTLVAGLIGHAFAYYVGFEWRMVGWLFGIAGVTFAQYGALHHTRKSIGQSIFSTLKMVFILELIVIAFVLAMYRSFAVVEIQAAVGLVLIVATLEAIHYSKTRSEFSIKLMFGIGLTILAVICHVGKLAVSNWFNHMDLGHVLMALALFIMFKGLQSEQKLNPVIL